MSRAARAAFDLARRDRISDSVVPCASAAKAAAAIMGMNNVFYRFRHLSSNPNYGAMPARLRMQAIRNHGGDPVDFELWCLAVSAINACARSSKLLVLVVA